MIRTIIDCEHHYYPRELVMKHGGKPGEVVTWYDGGMPKVTLHDTLHRVDEHLEAMSIAGIDVAVLAAWDHPLDKCKIINDRLAQLMQERERTGADMLVGGAASLEPWVTKSPAVARRVWDTFDEAFRYIRDHPLEVLSWEENRKVFGFTSDEEIKLAAKRFPKIFDVRWDNKMVESAKYQVQESVKAGFLEAKALEYLDVMFLALPPVEGSLPPR